MSGLRSKMTSTTDTRSEIVHHLELAMVTARGTARPAFFEHLERARALCMPDADLASRGKLARWQRRRAEELLAAAIEGHIPLNDIAAECGLSRGHFARAFRNTLGVSPRSWVRRLRVESAKRMMETRTLTLSEIAAATGFSDQSHLSRTFKRATGMSPTEYRRSLEAAEERR